MRSTTHRQPRLCRVPLFRRGDQIAKVVKEIGNAVILFFLVEIAENGSLTPSTAVLISSVAAVRTESNTVEDAEGFVDKIGDRVVFLVLGKLSFAETCRRGFSLFFSDNETKR